MAEQQGNFTMLNNSNYDVWKLKMEMFLSDKELWDVITLEQPTETRADQDAWNKANKSAKAKVAVSVEDNKLTQQKAKKMSTLKTNSALLNPQFDCVVQLERLSDSIVAEMTAGRPVLQPQQAKKMSTSKTNSSLSNPQFTCVVQLERLSDSVVAEMTGHRPALQPQAKKMSTLKTNSSVLNPQFTCVVQLERLSESVVAEMTGQRPALQPQTMESNNDTLSINSLPTEMLINIFSHLSQNELGKMARVCRSWNELTKSPVLWKEVNVELHNNLKSQTTAAKCFVNRLPSCVTFIRLHYSDGSDGTKQLNFEELCATLQKRCPHLETLILQRVCLSDNLPSVIGLCNHFLPDLKNLIFHHSIFADCSTREEFGSITSKIEVLGVSSCYLTLRQFKPPFSRMPNLKKLSLYDTFGIYSWFQEDSSFLNQLKVLNIGGTGIGFREFKEVFNHGLNLRELYICSTLLSEDFNFLLLFVVNNDLNFNNSVFPHLKTVCLGGCQSVTCKDVVSLIQSCQSLQNVYVMRDVAIRYAAHPFVVANKCKLEIVKSTFDCNDHQIVNRLCD